LLVGNVAKNVGFVLFLLDVEIEVVAIERILAQVPEFRDLRDNADVSVM
jgi:hypothetical protein